MNKKTMYVFVAIALWSSCIVLGSVHLVQSRTQSAEYVETSDMWHTPVFRDKGIEHELVLRKLLDACSHGVTVYPTENHYYFRMNIGGRHIAGNLCLPVSERDQGVAYLAYYDLVNGVTDSVSQLERVVRLSKSTNVDVRKAGKNRYVISAYGSSAEFKINDVQWTRDQVPLGSESETAVAPYIDESGIRFDLVFYETTNSFFYQTSQSLMPSNDRLLYRPSGLVFHPRSGFLFFSDPVIERLVLIAVSNDSVLKNDWYDGPCDQTPENLMFSNDVQLLRYVLKVNPSLMSKMDQLGVYSEDKSSRLAIASYDRYSNIDAYIEKRESEIAEFGGEWFKKFLPVFTFRSLGVD